MQSCLSHEREESYGFQRDRFTARVRTCDNEHSVVSAEGYGYRDYLILIKERLARSVQVYERSVYYLRCGGVHLIGKLRAGENKRKLGYIEVVES